jgi:hypothetical protein
MNHQQGGVLEKGSSFKKSPPNMASWAPGQCPSTGPACLAETSMFTSGFKVQGELEPGQVSLDRQLILKLAARGQWK